jgi:hypothetical protein
MHGPPNFELIPVSELMYALSVLSVILYESETIAGFHIFRLFNQMLPNTMSSTWSFEAGGTVVICRVCSFSLVWHKSFEVNAPRF